MMRSLAIAFSTIVASILLASCASQATKAKQQNLRLAQGYLDIHEYDSAKRVARKVLDVDPYDADARNLMEEIELARQKTETNEGLRDHVRSVNLSAPSHQVRTFDLALLFSSVVPPKL